MTDAHIDAFVLVFSTRKRIPSNCLSFLWTLILFKGTIKKMKYDVNWTAWAWFCICFIDRIDSSLILFFKFHLIYLEDFILYIQYRLCCTALLSLLKGTGWGVTKQHMFSMLLYALYIFEFRICWEYFCSLSDHKYLIFPFIGLDTWESDERERSSSFHSFCFVYRKQTLYVVLKIFMSIS